MTVIPIRAVSVPTLLLALCALFGAQACATEAPDADSDAGNDSPEAASRGPSGEIARLLDSGEAVFGIFSGEQTPERGMEVANVPEADFVFYSLEQGPFDIPRMERYMEGMREAGGTPHPVLLRIPPIGEERDDAREHVRQGLEAGVDGIVFPHVKEPEEAELAVETMRDDLWPSDPDGERVNVIIIEDRRGIENAREIVRTPGLSVVIPGPGDLRRAYDGDMEAVESAIQKVLELCLELDVPCGITAGTDDIRERLDQGFRLIISGDPEALAIGREAAGRAR